MKIHALQTGTVSVKQRQQHGKGKGPMRLVHTMLSREWTQPLPILAWVIEHPEGIIVVDTGETAKTSKSGYFTWWHPYFKLAMEAHVHPKEEIDTQLKRLGIRPADVRWVIMTHLHTDHAGGIYHFPKSEFIVSGKEFVDASGFKGKANGYLPQHLPAWFKPTLVDYRDGVYGSFHSSHRVTKNGDVVIVPTPGHTAGHQSVIVKDQSLHYFLAGDTSYTEELMQKKVIDGVTSNMGDAVTTMNSIHKFVNNHPTVYLPSHDPGSQERLRHQKTVSLHSDHSGVHTGEVVLP